MAVKVTTSLRYNIPLNSCVRKGVYVARQHDPRRHDKRTSNSNIGSQALFCSHRKLACYKPPPKDKNEMNGIQYPGSQAAVLVATAKRSHNACTARHHLVITSRSLLVPCNVNINNIGALHTAHVIPAGINPLSHNNVVQIIVRPPSRPQLFQYWRRVICYKCCHLLKFLRKSSLASISRRLNPTTSCHMHSCAMPEPVCCVSVCDRISLAGQGGRRQRYSTYTSDFCVMRQ